MNSEIVQKYFSHVSLENWHEKKNAVSFVYCVVCTVFSCSMQFVFLMQVFPPVPIFSRSHSPYLSRSLKHKMFVKIQNYFHFPTNQTKKEMDNVCHIFVSLFEAVSLFNVSLSLTLFRDSIEKKKIVLIYLQCNG